MQPIEEKTNRLGYLFAPPTFVRKIIGITSPDEVAVAI